MNKLECIKLYIKPFRLFFSAIDFYIQIIIVIKINTKMKILKLYPRLIMEGGKIFFNLMSCNNW